MNTSITTSGTMSPSRRNLWVWLGWSVVLSALGYFLVQRVPRFLVVTEASYGSYFWPKAGWLFPHVVSGVLAIIIGPLQFWPRIRREYSQAHRIAGRVYVGVVLIGAIAALGMASGKGRQDAAFGLGLCGLAIAWIVTTGMAFLAIRRKNIGQHRQWMVRSYVITFAFVTFRLAADLLEAGDMMNRHERFAMLAWACWAVPLLFAEVALQATDVFKQRPR